MPNTSNRRWYDDPNTGLPTIRRSEQARNDATPEQVKAWMQGDATRAAANYPIQSSVGSAGVLPLGEDDEDEDCDHCPTCGQSTDEEDDPR